MVVTRCVVVVVVLLEADKADDVRLLKWQLDANERIVRRKEVL